MSARSRNVFHLPCTFSSLTTVQKQLLLGEDFINAFGKVAYLDSVEHRLIKCIGVIVREDIYLFVTG